MQGSTSRPDGSHATRRIACPQGAGFTYLAVILLVTLLALSLVAAARVWRVEQQRENETELLFVGRQFRLAIEDYSKRTSPPRYPRSLTELLTDQRTPVAQHELRRLYSDPFTHKPRWGVLLDDSNGIIGVYSLAPGEPHKRTGFRPEEGFDESSTYREWKFFAQGTAARAIRYAIADPDFPVLLRDPHAPGATPAGSLGVGDGDGAIPLAPAGESSAAGSSNHSAPSPRTGR